MLIVDSLKSKLIRNRIPWIIALGSLILAAFFRFALIGYSTLALTFACISVVIALYLLTPKWFRVMLTILLCLGVLLFVVAEVPVIRAARGEADRDAEYLIVLGAGVNGSTPSLSMRDRLVAALDYLDAHPACVAVLTGGQGTGENVTEARAMADWLSARGIPAERLILEEQATNTAENLRFSFPLIPEGAVCAVCSSEYHLCRAELMARDLGRELFGVPGKTSLPVLRVNYFIREALGMVHYKIFGI